MIKIPKEYSLLSRDDKKLRAVNKKVDPKDPALPQLIEDMYQKMHEWNGIGLAAPQFGLNIRLAVVDTGKGEKFALINPEITFASKEMAPLEEGCLNFPGEFLRIDRPKKIRIKFQEVGGKAIKMKAHGLLAKVFQHETDHLNQKLIIDRGHYE